MLFRSNLAIDLHDQAKQNNISIKEALEFGIRFKLADTERSEVDYPVNNLQKKLHKFVEMFQAKVEECEALRKQVPKVDEIKEDQDDADKVFDTLTDFQKAEEEKKNGK